MLLRRTNRPLGAAIFDLDGTLVNTSGDITEAANHLLTVAGKEQRSQAEVLSYVGHGASYLIRGLLGLKPVDDLEPWLEIYQIYYSEHQGEGSTLYPDIRDCLTELQEDFDLYVLSNKPHAAVVSELNIHGIVNYFKAAFGAGVLSALKPAPIGLQLALEMSGLPPRRAVMVGDSPQDVAAGRAASTNVIHVQWGFGKLGAGDPEPDVAISDSSMLGETVREVLVGTVDK